MSAENFEAFLTAIYVDKDVRKNFLTGPMTAAKKYGLSNDECEKLKNMDIIGLEFAARSFERKREMKLKHTWKHFPPWFRSIFGFFK